MLKPIPLALVDELAKPVTDPFYLVELLFDPTPRYYSTRHTVTYFGHLFSASTHLTVGRIEATSAGGRTANINIYTKDLLSESVSQGFRNSRVLIHMGYGDGIINNPPESDLVTLFDGIISKSVTDKDKITLSCSTIGILTQSSPRIFIRSPVFNYLPGGNTIATIRIGR